MNFGKVIFYDETSGEPIAADLRIRDGKATGSKEINEGAISADYASNGMLLRIEFVLPCEPAILFQLTSNEPQDVRDFVARAMRIVQIWG